VGEKMKSLDEACARFQGANLDEVNERFEGLGEEIRNNPRVHALFAAILSSGYHPGEMLYSAFAWGVGVGIEMEKREDGVQL
jgi:hypothetical protein